MNYEIILAGKGKYLLQYAYTSAAEKGRIINKTASRGLSGGDVEDFLPSDNDEMDGHADMVRQ